MDYYKIIKEELINNQVYKKVKDYSKNKSDLRTYYNVGKLLVDAQGGEKRAKYGDQLIKEYSIKLTEELGKEYSISSLKRMRKFFLIIEKGATLSHQLIWSFYYELLPITDINKINYYIKIGMEQNLSVRELRNKIKNKEYERLDDKVKDKLVNQKDITISDFIKNSILIKNSLNYSEISEKILKKLILEDIDNFLKELGSGFTYVGSEYKIKIGYRYNYIDFLLFNIEFNCYVVIELKVTELKKEHIGQIKTYMKYIDRNIKKVTQENTIGIIIVKKENKFIMEYCSDKRIFEVKYLLV